MKLFQYLFIEFYLLLVYLSVSVLSQDDESTEKEPYQTDFDFCSLTCDGKPHTVCEYPEGGPPACNGLTRGLMENMRRTVIQVHNDYRQQVAMGKGDGGEPPAANMVELEWSEEAAMIAQRWADQCTEDRRLDECRTMSNRVPGGQNIAVASHNEEFDVYKYLQLNVKDWFKIGSSFNKDSLKNYKPDPSSASYTQIIWALTDAIGCGYVYGKVNGSEIYRLVCNYYPAGNVPGEPVYEQGKPCSKCPNAKCSGKYPALCAAPSDHVWNRGDDNTSVSCRPSGFHYTFSTVSIFLVSLMGRIYTTS